MPAWRCPPWNSSFGTKARLLKAVIDTAIAGDDEPVPMLARQWAARAESMTAAAEFTTAFAQQLTDSARRAAGLTLVALEAPPGPMRTSPPSPRN